MSNPIEIHECSIDPHHEHEHHHHEHHHEDKNHSHAHHPKSTPLSKLIGILTLLLASGISFAGTVAMISLFNLSLAVLLPIFVGLFICGGLPEASVYHPYLRRFARLCQRGFFESIEHHILKKAIKKEIKESIKEINGENEAIKTFDKKKKTLFKRALKQEASKQFNRLKQKKSPYLDDLRKKHANELRFKKAAALLAFPIAACTAIGFSALIFTQMGEFLAMLGVASGLALSLTPWTIAIPIGIIYALAMYAMIHQAIKKNIFKEIKHKIVDLFQFKNENNHTPLTHLALCLLKAVGLGIVLAVAICATLFTAGAWLHTSVSFFTNALHIVEGTARALAWPIFAMMNLTAFSFSIENSLKTVKTLCDIDYVTIGNAIKNVFIHPIDTTLYVLKGLYHAATHPVDTLAVLVGKISFLIFCGIHFVSVGATAIYSGLEYPFSLMGEIPSKLASFFTSTFSEIFNDSHAIIDVVSSTKESKANKSDIEEKDCGHDHSISKANLCKIFYEKKEKSIVRLKEKFQYEIFPTHQIDSETGKNSLKFFAAKHQPLRGKHAGKDKLGNDIFKCENISACKPETPTIAFSA